jgi:hypothetical protein
VRTQDIERFVDALIAYGKHCLEKKDVNTALSAFLISVDVMKKVALLKVPSTVYIHRSQVGVSGDLVSNLQFIAIMDGCSQLAQVCKQVAHQWGGLNKLGLKAHKILVTQSKGLLKIERIDKGFEPSVYVTPVDKLSEREKRQLLAIRSIREATMISTFQDLQTLSVTLHIVLRPSTK